MKVRKQMKLFRLLLVVIVLFIVFILYSGRLSIYTLLAAILVSSLVVLYAIHELPYICFHGLIYIIPLVIDFIATEIREHLLMARTIVSRGARLQPVIVEIPLSIKSDTSIAILSHIITNTPGTIVVDVDKERRIMRVHWLFPTTTEPGKAKEAIVGRFEKYLEKIFG